MRKHTDARGAQRGGEGGGVEGLIPWLEMRYQVKSRSAWMIDRERGENDDFLEMSKHMGGAFFFPFASANSQVKSRPALLKRVQIGEFLHERNSENVINEKHY